MPTPATTEPDRYSLAPARTGAGLARLTVVESGVPVVDAAGAAYDEADREYREAVTEYRLVTDRKAIAAAEQADAEATAAAIEAGKPDAGSTHVAALNARAAELVRMRNGRQIVVERRAADYLAALDDHRAKVVERGLRELDAARKVAHEAIAATASAIAEVDRLRERCGWIDEGPRRKDRSKATGDGHDRSTGRPARRIRGGTRRPRRSPERP